MLKLSLAAALGSALSLSGCGTIVRIAVEAETERLEKLRTWEARIAAYDCQQLTDEYVRLEKIKGDLVDFDQRQDTMRDEMTNKRCALPEGLA